MSPSSAPDASRQVSAPLVIGVGHRHRQDDAVGPSVAEALAAKGHDAVVHEGDGLALIELWSGRSHCVIVDALAGDAEPGRVFRFEAGSRALAAASFVRSSHKIGVAEAVALAQRLGRLPERLTVIGIAGRRFGFGAEMSPEVRHGADVVVEELAEIGATEVVDSA